MQTRLHYLKLEQKRQRERERKYKAMSRGISQFHTFLDFTLHEVRKFSIQVNQPIIQIFCKIYGNFFFFPQVQNLLTSLSQLCFFNYHNVRGFFTPFILTFQPSFMWLSHFCSLIVERENKTKNKNNNNNRGCGICYC